MHRVDRDHLQVFATRLLPGVGALRLLDRDDTVAAQVDDAVDPVEGHRPELRGRSHVDQHVAPVRQLVALEVLGCGALDGLVVESLLDVLVLGLAGHVVHRPLEAAVGGVPERHEPKDRCDQPATEQHVT